MVRKMKVWKPQQMLSMNMRVFEALKRLGCWRGEPFLIAVGKTFNLYIGKKLAYKGLTKTDLKQFSRLACKTQVDIEIDIHQPLMVEAFDKDSHLIVNERVNVQKLRKIL